MSQKKTILLVAPPGYGKTLGLRNLPLEKVLYINSDGKSEIIGPGLDKEIGKVVIPEDPLMINASLEVFENSNYEYIVIDTIDFYADQIESEHVLTADNTQSAWGMYGQRLKELLNFARLKSSKTWIFMSHVQEGIRGQETSTIKGAVGKQGLEAYFQTILVPYKYDLAQKSLLDSVIGYGYITKPTLQYRNTAARSTIGTFPDMIRNNDLDLILRRLDGEKIDWNDDDVIFEKDKLLAKKLGL